MWDKPALVQPSAVAGGEGYTAHTRTQPSEVDSSLVEELCIIDFKNYFQIT